MADDNDNRYRHFILDGYSETERFVKPSLRISQKTIPRQDRWQHGNALLEQLRPLANITSTSRDALAAAGIEGGFGLQIEFESFPDIELAFEKLARERSGIELLNVRYGEQVTFATVFVPDGKLSAFESLLRAYMDQTRDTKRGARNQALIDTIRQIRAASIRALWTDDPAVFPAADDEVFWWEFWLPVSRDRAATVERFRRLAQLQQMEIAPGQLEFPDRTVLLVRTSAAALSRSMMTINSIAELRRAKETAEFFDEMALTEQRDWHDNILRQLRIAPPEQNSPYVCLLDTGVNRGHQLLSNSLSPNDLHTVDPAWGNDDDDGHGTAQAGVSLLGDLTHALSSADVIEVTHRLESVKLLPRGGSNGNDPRHHGYLTTEAVSRPEITASNRKRVFCMSATAMDQRDRGRPSAWSATIDGLAADVANGGESRRLIVVAAGNIGEERLWQGYPESNSTEGIHDPAQAWNALTVGAYTELVTITDRDAPDYRPIAPSGALSPLSTTSMTWQPRWPLKPDVVLEGGNVARDAMSAHPLPSLSLLSTHHRPLERLFTTTNATSAASALAAKMAAELMAEYPDLWPETIRGLIVHSADWTMAMRQSYLPQGRAPTKAEVLRLVRHCGFGVPNVEHARWSASNELSMVVQSSLCPFQRKGKALPTYRDINLHRLPWPVEELRDLADQEVELRVTLSYFIEPNPSERGFRSRYRYESHGLRFDMKRPSESVEQFRGRVNRAARDEEESTFSTSGDGGWVVGAQGRSKGSIHSDRWMGTGADLAERGVLAVYPVIGWWKSRAGLGRYDSNARYALVVSIRAPEVDIDLYSAVANRIATPVAIAT